MDKRISTSKKILDAAEDLFSQRGYDAVSIRQITSAAGVRLGLAHYHFDSKEALFNAVIRRRINLLTTYRLNLLQHYLDEHNGAPLPLHQLVAAFVTPYLYWCITGGPGWRSYARLAAGLQSDNLKALQEMFDPGALVFLKEMRRAMPVASEASVQWGFDFMVGLMCNTFAEVDRIHTLSDGICSTGQIDVACSYMVNFISSGLTTLAENRRYDFSAPLAILESFDIFDKKDI